MGTQELHKSLNEKDVENLYRHSLMKKFMKTVCVHWFTN